MKGGDNMPVEEYEVVKLPKALSKGRWRTIFDPLKLGEAVKYECSSASEAGVLRNRIFSSLKVKEISYKLASRTEKQGDKTILYIWKFMKES